MPTLTPFVGHNRTPGSGREERCRTLCVHDFFLLFFKNLFCSCNEGFFPPSVFTKRKWKASDRKKWTFRHRHSSRVSLLARHNPAPTKRHSTEMPFRCLLFPAFSKQDETPFVGSSLARPHTLARCLSTPSEHNETPFRAQNPLHQLF